MMQEKLEAVARERIQETRTEIEHSLRCVHQGVPYAAEDQIARREAAIKRGLRVPDAIAKMQAESTFVPQPEAIRGRTVDFVPISYMERGLIAARAVARVALHDGRGQGTGFLCSNRLFITNHHVISSPEQASLFRAQFNYETDLDGAERPVTSFRFSPETFFFTDGIDGLDITIIGLGERVEGVGDLTSFGWCPLSDSATKHALGDHATIIQHPQGRRKEVVLRENLIAGRHDVALHYVTDTEPGSSGAPVFNANWQPIALHHWGGVHIAPPAGSYRPSMVNEGIRISSIVRRLHRIAPSLPLSKRTLLDEVFSLGEVFPTLEQGGPLNPAYRTAPTEPLTGPQARVNKTGGITWTVPIEVSVNMPLGSAGDTVSDPAVPASTPAPSFAPHSESSIDFSDRSGYRPDFIEDTVIPLPALKPTLAAKIARIPADRIPPGGNDFELRYQHFSIVMNEERRLAFYTACNIHGASLTGVNDSGDTYVYTDTSTAFRESLERAESTDWDPDPRIETTSQAVEKYFKSTPNRLVDANGHADLIEEPNFDRGHLVRRLTPAWGTPEQAKLAEQDTFFSTNVAPQTPSFNQGKAKGLLGPQLGRLWQGIENYILRNAWAADTKVTVFTGPVFAEDDPVYSDKLENINIQVPLKFWKVIVWKEDDELKSLALVADQTPTLTKQSGGESLPGGFLDDAQLDLVSSFLTTVAKVEGMTGLEFGDDVSQADVRFGHHDGDPGDSESLIPGIRPPSRSEEREEVLRRSPTPRKKTTSRKTVKKKTSKRKTSKKKTAAKTPRKKKA